MGVQHRKSDKEYGPLLQKTGEAATREGPGEKCSSNTSSSNYLHFVAWRKMFRSLRRLTERLYMQFLHTLYKVGTGG